MALPGQLDRLVREIVTQSELEAKFLQILIKRLDNSISALNKAFGSDCAHGCYDALIDSALKERTSECFDRYEQCLEQAILARLRRPLTEREEELASELIGHITGITELLFSLGGVELQDLETEEPDQTGGVG